MSTWVVPKEYLDQAEEIAALKAQLAAAEKRAKEASEEGDFLYRDLSAALDTERTRAEAAEKRVEGLKKELTLSEDRYHTKRRELRAAESRLRDAEKRAEEASLFLQDEMKKSADWYLAHEERREELEDCQERLRDAEAREAVLVCFLTQNEWVRVIINTDHENDVAITECLFCSGDKEFGHEEDCLLNNTLSTLSPRSAAVLAVLDAARNYMNSCAGECPLCNEEICQAVRNLDKEA